MRFNRITFNNYRCFLNGSIDFVKSPNKNMTVLIAPNGGGKTETLFAFWWTLYDYDFSKLTNKEQTPYALNSALYRKLEQSETGAKEECSVILEFEENNITYQVKKRCEYRKTDKRIKVQEFRELSNFKENGELSLKIEDVELINKKLSRIIPKNILYGIIFDGERMQKLNTADESSVNAIRAVISDITNVELLENCSENFKRIKRKLNKNIKRVENNKPTTKSLENILNDESAKSKERKDLSNDLISYQTDLESVKNELARIHGLLEKNNEVKEIEANRVQKKKDLDKLEKQLDVYYKNFSDTLRDGYLIASTKLLSDVNAIIKSYDIPQDLTVSAVESILKHPKCICGRELDDDAKDVLKKLIKMLPPDNINSTLAEIIRQTYIRIEDIKKQAKEKYNEIKDCEKEIRTYKSDIAFLSTQITSLDDSGEATKNAKELEKQNQEYIEKRGYLTRTIPNTENEISELDKEIENLRKQRENFKFNSDESKKINAQITYIEKCCNAVERIKNINKETALEDINHNLENSYKLLSEDADRGRRIKIIHHKNNSSYQIAVYMEEDYNQLITMWKNDGIYELKKKQGLSETDIEEEAIIKCIDSNSTGQSKINTFAFVKAILDYSNSAKSEDGIEVTKDYPLLIDAPFGDISAGNLSKSSRELHNFSNQVILMIDEDKYEALRNAFDPYTANKYMFNKVNGKNYSTITPRED